MSAFGGAISSPSSASCTLSAVKKFVLQRTSIVPNVSFLSTSQRKLYQVLWNRYHSRGTLQIIGDQRQSGPSARGHSCTITSVPSCSGAAEEGKEMKKMAIGKCRVRFCAECGSPTETKTPPGDERPRDVCTACASVHYVNPKLVVGMVCTWENQVLLCRRAIEPCRGLWGFPQGFLELGETTREGAEREAMEEAGVEAKAGPLLAVYNIPNQVQLLYLSKLSSPVTIPGVESLEARLFDWDAIPTSELAFPTVGWALDYAQEVIKAGGPFLPQERTKTVAAKSPNDLAAERDLPRKLGFSSL